MPEALWRTDPVLYSQGLLMLLACHLATSGRLTPRCWPVNSAAVILDFMSEVTRILSAIEQGDPSAASQLLPLVYDELRQLAAQKLAQEKPGQTLQATALVHEAYLRLVDVDQVQHWNSRGHFFAAAAEAMRRILIENARRKKADKRGGQLKRVSLDHADAAAVAPPDELLAVDEALERLGRHDPVAGQLVKLRYYAGLSLEQAALALGISSATAYRHWTFGRAWLHGQLLADSEESGS
jgi:RNA polymerase sigma factor (TIGR02999 family)